MAQFPFKQSLVAALGSLLISTASSAQACWEEAANRYQVSSQLLHAIARTESALNPQAIGRNRNGSRDIGLMQINSWWLPKLAQYGIRERDLFDPCISIHVGAWILAQNVARHGYTWEAVGAYNATTPALRAAYIARVRRHLAPEPGSERRASSSPAIRPASHLSASPVFHP